MAASLGVAPRGKQKAHSQRDALSTFVPQTMKWILEEKSLEVPYSKQFPSVALFADISGFTNLTEKLSSLPGTIGVETLADEINNYLTQIIKQIVGSGGDIFKFAGDALLCVWPPDKDELDDPIKQWKKLPTTVHRVIQCALHIQRKIGQMSKCNVKELTLKVKLGIGVGNVDVLIVGGIMGRYENLPAGQAFFEAFNCEDDHPDMEKGQPGKVIISNKCYHMVKHAITDWEKVGERGNIIVNAIKPTKKLAGKMGGNSGHMTKNDALFKKFSKYIPSAVVPHLKMPEQAWVGELRQVTIMFLSLPFDSADIKNIQSENGKILRDIHDAIRSLQSIIYKYQGSLNKFLVDDKGSTVMAVFGLPPVAHRNDPERAVMAALDLRTKFATKYTKNLVSLLGGSALDANRTQEEYDRDKIKKDKKDKKNKKKKGKTETAEKDKKKSGKDKHRIAIGITSGIVYLGLVGGAGSRREYSVLGDKVNLAARLMGLCKKYPETYGEIAVDESIREKVNMEHLVKWKFIKKTKVKGKKQEIKVSKPIPQKFMTHLAKPPTAWLTDASDKHYITECSKVIEDLHQQQRGKTVFVEGETGLGKAALIRRVMDQTKNRVWWLWGKGTWIHETKEDIKFPVWKQILLAFCKKYPFYLEKNRKSFESYIKKRRPDLQEWLFLLSYFDLVSFLSPQEKPEKMYKKEKKDAVARKLKGTNWARNEKAVQKIKDKIEQRMQNSEEVGKLREKFIEKLDRVTDDKERKIQETKFQADLQKKAEAKVDKKIGNFVYDIVLCLLEWGGGKLSATKPIVIVIDGLQWLRTWDWSLTRRLFLMLNNRIIKHVGLFVSATPMDNKKYRPHYIKDDYEDQYKEMRDSPDTIIISPSAWGIQKTKKYVKSYFKHDKNPMNVRDVAPKFVETIHSQCGGRPGFCKEFLDILKNKNIQNIENKHPPILAFEEMRIKGEKKLSFSNQFEDHLSSKLQYSSIPIPPTVQAITARHLDVLDPESMLLLKTAASICIAKGTRCLSFLKSTLIGSHPIAQFVKDDKSKEKIDKKLQKLCIMRFITKLPNEMDISHVVFPSNNNNNGHNNNNKTLPCQLYKQSSRLNNTQHGQLENSMYSTSIASHHHTRNIRNGSMDSSIKGRYGGTINNVVNRNKMNDSLTDASAFGLTHLRSLSSVSQSAGSEVMEDEIKTSTLQSDPNEERKGQNMPPTSDLVNKPFDGTPWHAGTLIKSKGGLMSKGSERLFVFKGKTLYWFRDTRKDKYPLGRIKFDESILRLQLNEKKNETIIKVSRKKYVLRAESLDEMKKFFVLFQTAMNSGINKRSTINSRGSTHSVHTNDGSEGGDSKRSFAQAGYGGTLNVSEKAIIDEENSMNFEASNLERPNIDNNNKRDYSLLPSATRSASVPEGSITNTAHHQQSQDSILSTTQITNIHNYGECYEFTHGFLRDAIYEQMLFTQRIRIHKSAQKYLRKVLQAISKLPEYPSKALDNRDYDTLLKRHEAIAGNYQNQQNSIGQMIQADNIKKPKRHRLPNFVGLN